MNLINPVNQYQERWYQRDAIQSIFDYFDAGNNGNPVLALPTAAGKTHVISGFIKRVLNTYTSQRFMVATHVKELIEQNADKFSKAWPHAPFGIYSAGMKSRDYMQPIIFGGVQSMVKAPELFGHRDMLIVDEAHLVSPAEGSNYQLLIGKADGYDERGKFVPGYGLRKINPNLKVVGLSATIFRQGIGYITDEHAGRIFTDIAYNLCTMEGFARLIAEGYLSPLIPKRTSIEIDTSEFTRGANGDFNQKQLQDAANRERVTHAALTEACRFGYNRRSWLVFASGIEHAENVSNMLNSFGISSTFVHSKISNDERDKRINAHKDGRVRCLVGNNIFTTGYDHPPLDFIIDLQPTMSVAKHVQKYGRGMRVSPDTYKENCLILDFGGNVRRCGPINDPYIPKRKGEGSGEVPVKICEACGTYNHISARFCVDCGEPFEFQTKIVKKAGEEEILKSDLPITEIFDVTNVIYWKHISAKTGIPALVCSYYVGLTKFDEWVNFENPKARHFANEWWRARSPDDPPVTVDDALTKTRFLRVPRQISVWTNRKHPMITRVIW